MKEYEVKLTIKAECPSDVEELINEYTGQETDVSIKAIKEEKENE